MSILLKYKANPEDETTDDLTENPESVTKDLNQEFLNDLISMGFASPIAAFLLISPFSAVCSSVYGRKIIDIISVDPQFSFSDSLLSRLAARVVRR